MGLGTNAAGGGGGGGMLPNLDRLYDAYGRGGGGAAPTGGLPSSTSDLMDWDGALAAGGPLGHHHPHHPHHRHGEGASASATEPGEVPPSAGFPAEPGAAWYLPFHLDAAELGHELGVGMGGAGAGAGAGGDYGAIFSPDAMTPSGGALGMRRGANR